MKPPRENLVRKTCPSCKLINKYLVEPPNYTCGSCYEKVQGPEGSKDICSFCTHKIIKDHIREFHKSVDLV